MAVNNIATVVPKGAHGAVATSTRLSSATRGSDVWMRAMILTPTTTRQS